MSSSETGPAVIPSGGEEVRFLYSWKRRLEARADAIFGVGRVGVEGRWWILGTEVCGFEGKVERYGLCGSDGMVCGFVKE